MACSHCFMLSENKQCKDGKHDQIYISTWSEVEN